ncbi:hypothetical protein XENTR_v10012702 [Xenopus tropicalis]|nr:hypothetical protein XENTR_v10012702 [Xenopus tropicalis]
MAPEIIDDMAYSRAVDWCALGVVLYVMLMFQFPFDAEDDMELFESIRNDRPALTEELSEEAQCLILRLLEKNPCDRLGSSEAGAEEVKAHEFFEVSLYCNYCASSQEYSRTSNEHNPLYLLYLSVFVCNLHVSCV